MCGELQSLMEKIASGAKSFFSSSVSPETETTERGTQRSPAGLFSFVLAQRRKF